jgi:putative ABC transport system substrate-binding protein
MRRRVLFKAIGGVAAMWPLSLRAQQPAMPVIGFLSSRSAIDSAPQVAAFRQALSEAGYVEDQSVAIEYRWADGQYDRLPGLAADLVSRQVAVIFAGGPAAYVAKAATTAIPIVFVSGEDPVDFGLVASFNRPVGNITGVSTFNAVLGSKRFEVLHELVPNAAVLALLVNPNNPRSVPETRETQAAARAIGRNLIILNASTESEIDAAFATLVQQRVDALVVTGDPFFVGRRDKVVALAARHAVPTIYTQREFAAAGGLIGYGTSLEDAYRQVGIYTSRILKGAKVADLPVVRPTRFDLVINLRTAKALGLTVPQSILARADEVMNKLCPHVRFESFASLCDFRVESGYREQLRTCRSSVMVARRP